MDRTDFDAVIVGASIAGSSAAIRLAQRGFRILLLDRARFPRRKVCGEGLMPAGVEILSEMGFDQELSQRGAVFFRGIRFLLPDGPGFDIPFSRLGADLRGCAVPRLALDEMLVRRAAQFSQVTMLEGWTVQGAVTTEGGIEVLAGSNGSRESFQARLLVGADGIRSRWPRRFGIRVHRARYRRFAMGALFAEYRGDPGRVDVHTIPFGEAYVAPRCEGGALVTLLLSAPEYGLGGASAESFQRLLGRFPGLEGLLGGPPLEVRAAAPLGMRLDRSHGQRLILLGDAAGAVDPLTGQGMTMALRDARLATELLESRLAADRLSESALAEYTRRRNLYFQPAYRLAEDLLTAFQHPAAARRIARSLTRNASLRRKLLDSAVAPAPARTLSLLDKLRLVAGI